MTDSQGLTTRLLQGQGVDLELAAQALREGKLVAFPTETVYGLGGLVSRPDAVRGIFQAKGRPADHPLIAHAAVGFNWDGWADLTSPAAQALIQAFWPGPLTLIVPKGPKMPASVTGGQDSVGVRCPSHPVAQALLAKLDAPVAAPSANRFGKVSPTLARHVQSELDGRIAGIVEGGPAQVGIESTIVSVLDGQCVILRPGVITPADIESATGLKVTGFSSAVKSQQPRVSGSLEKHYSPDARLLVLSPAEFSALMPTASSDNSSELAKSDLMTLKVLVAGWSKPFLGAAGHVASLRNCSGLEVQVCSFQAKSVAQHLYRILRRADEDGFDLLIVEKPPEEAAWQGVADRLQRAAAR